MSVYNRYILGQIARPMVTTIVVALVALLAERTLRVVDLVVGWRGSLLVVFEMLGYLVPHYMGLAIPAAFFLGVLLTFARLSREGELAAIYASGVGLGQLMRPIMVAALVLAGVTALLVSNLQPYGRFAYRAATQALTNASFHTLLQGGVFTTLNDTTYMVEGLSADKSELRRVFLFSRDRGGNSITVTARTGEVARAGPMTPITLRLKDGVQQVVTAPPATGEQATRPSEVVLRFRNFETAFGQTPDALQPRGESERELTILELWQARADPPKGIHLSEIDAELNGRLVRILTLPVLGFLAVPLALGRIRGQRSYGLVIGLALLVGYYQLTQFGEALVDNGKIGALIGLWLPFLAFTLLALGLFRRAATRVADPKGVPWLDRAIDGAAGLLRHLRARALRRA